MKRKIILALFLVMSLIQLTAVGYNIFRYETILATGTVWKFEVEPIDPYDVLRGRYVRLGFKASQAPLAPVADRLFFYKETYVILEKKGEFTKPLQVVTEKPKGITDDWLACSISRHFTTKTNNVNVKYTFDRFYMNEKLAPKAEELLRQNSDLLNKSKVYVSVRVKDGIGVIENLWVDGVPMNEYLRSRANEE